MTTIKEFVEYAEDVFFSDVQDVNGINVAKEMFIECYKRNDFINSELIVLLNAFLEKMKEENKGVDSEFLALLTGAFLGLAFSKFSIKIKLEDE